MTHKHFEALAAALKEIAAANVNKMENKCYYMRASDVTGGIADVCARFNPNFDRERFLKACGVEG